MTENIEGSGYTHPVMTFRCRTDGSLTIEDVDSGSKSVTGYFKTELTETRAYSLMDLVHPEDREKVRKHMQDGLSAGNTFASPFRILRKDQTDTPGVVVGKGFCPTQLTMTSIEGYIALIEPVRIENTNIDAISPNLYEKMLEITSDHVALTDNEGKIRYLSPSFLQILGYTGEQVQKRSFSSFLAPDNQSGYEESFRQTISEDLGETTHLFNLLSSSGDLIPVSMRIIPSGYDGVILAIEKDEPQDIPDSDEDLFRHVFTDNPIPQVITGSKDRIIEEVNEAFLIFSGIIQDSDVIGKSLLESGCFPDTARLVQIEQEILTHGHVDKKQTLFSGTEGETEIQISGRYITGSDSSHILFSFSESTEN